MYQNIRQLGMHVGHAPHTLDTTFLDPGPIPTDSPLRLAFGGIELALAAFVAGTLRLLRDPYFVYTLQTVRDTLGHSPFSQLFEQYARILAAVYGDTATLRSLREHIAETNAIRLPGVSQPIWLVDATKQRRSFSPGEERHVRAFVYAMLAPAAEAHFRCVHMQIPRHHIPHLVMVAEAAFGIPLGTHSLYDLTQFNTIYQGLPLMGDRLLVRSGAWDLMAGLLEIEIGDGIELGNFRKVYAALMTLEDRQAWGMDPRENDETQMWFIEYGNKLRRLHYRLANPSSGALHTSGELTEDDLFAVSFRQPTPN